jgi:hypothetical protein
MWSVFTLLHGRDSIAREKMHYTEKCVHYTLVKHRWSWSAICFIKTQRAIGLGTLWSQDLLRVQLFLIIGFSFANSHLKANQIKGAEKGKISEKSGSISQIRPSP